MGAAQHSIWVGVTAKHGDAAWNARWTQNYLDRVTELGAVPVVLAPDAPAVLPDGTTFQPDSAGRLPAEVLDRLDGLILAGGGDVDPSYFGAELNGADPSSIDRRRDELELNLARPAMATDLPVFGICRGCQVLNVAAGGRLVQHLDGHRSLPDAPIYHRVNFVAETPVRALTEQAAIEVNTYHHQGVDRSGLAPAFIPAGFADPDGWLIEAYASPTHRWVMGFQWHPERLFELPDAHREIWRSFAVACRAGRAAR